MALIKEVFFKFQLNIQIAHTNCVQRLLITAYNALQNYKSRSYYIQNNKLLFFIVFLTTCCNNDAAQNGNKRFRMLTAAAEHFKRFCSFRNVWFCKLSLLFITIGFQKTVWTICSRKSIDFFAFKVTIVIVHPNQHSQGNLYLNINLQ